MPTILMVVAGICLVTGLIVVAARALRSVRRAAYQKEPAATWESDGQTEYKICPKCSGRWLSRGEMLEDPEIRLLGFQPDARGPESGFFLFCHETCGTTLALGIPAVEDLTQMPRLSPSACSLGLDGAFCLMPRADKECPAQCTCNFVASVVRAIKAWPKR